MNAPSARVWKALVDPKAIKQYMFGTNVVSEWHEGATIIWKGEWQGKSYEDKGVILQLEPGRTIQYSHFSPLSGLPDKPENYHTVTIELSYKDNQTLVSLTQDKNADGRRKCRFRKELGNDARFPEEVLGRIDQRRPTRPAPDLWDSHRQKGSKLRSSQFRKTNLISSHQRVTLTVNLIPFPQFVFSSRLVSRRAGL